MFVPCHPVSGCYTADCLPGLLSSLLPQSEGAILHPWGMHGSFAEALVHDGEWSGVRDCHAS